MKLRISIDSDNNAMRTREDAWRALERVKAVIVAGKVAGLIRDVNGNTVGEWSLQIDDDDDP